MPGEKLGYRCYLLGADGHIVTRHEFEADSDYEALMTAQTFYAEQTNKNGFEVWQETRCVHTET